MLMIRIALLGVILALGACTSWQSKPESQTVDRATPTPVVVEDEPANEALPAATDTTEAEDTPAASVNAPATATRAPETEIRPVPASTSKPVEAAAPVNRSSVDKPNKPRSKPPASPERDPAPAREPKKAQATVSEPNRATPTQASAAATKPAPEPAPETSTITGRISLTSGGGLRVDAGDVRDAVVYFVPDSRRAQPTAGRYQIYTFNRDFTPAAIVVPVGSAVDFTNRDDIRHNVFSVTPGSVFNLGYQSAGDTATVTFDKPGVVWAGCNVHRGMNAKILVLGSRYATRARADGSYTLEQVPATSGTLYFWHPRARLASQVIRPPFSPTPQRLLVIKPAVPVEINLGAQP